MSLTKDNIKRVQKLEQALAALKSGQSRYFSITKLISIKSLCRNDDLRKEYCLYLSSLVMSELQTGHDKTPTKVKRLCQEAVSAINKVVNDPEYADSAHETLESMVHFQDTIIKMKWSNVRIVKNNSLFVLEKILQALLSSGDVALDYVYEATRYYVERYSPHDGTGLIGESIPMFEQIIRFWHGHACPK